MSTEDMVRRMVAALEGMAGGQNGNRANANARPPSVHFGPKLDEKYFRRIEKLDADPNKYRSWLFDLEVALGQIDGELQELVKYVAEDDAVRKVPAESWRPRDDP